MELFNAKAFMKQSAHWMRIAELYIMCVLREGGNMDDAMSIMEDDVLRRRFGQLVTFKLPFVFDAAQEGESSKTTPRTSVKAADFRAEALKHLRLGELLEHSVKQVSGETGILSDFLTSKMCARNAALLVLGRLKLDLALSEQHAPLLIPLGCEVVEDAKRLREFRFDQLIIDSVSSEAPGRATWQEIRPLAKKLGYGFALADAPKLLGADGRGSEIPTSFREKKILLPLTVIVGPDGSRYVPYLHVRKNQWECGMRHTSDGFGEEYVLLNVD